ncbi:MAG: putative subtilase-type serine protease precursor [Gemmataceae bacterium]|nr:putative subtilase-type serine protease precursor [Gemmataceae bacterium]
MRAALGLLVLTLVPAAAAAQNSFPMVTHVTPVAVQRGVVSEVTVDCRTSTLHGAYKVLVGGTGVTAEVVPAKDTKPADPKALPPVVPVVKLKITVAADAAPGVREFRIASTVGLSSLGQLVVVDDPVVAELPGNNLPAKAQPIPVPAVVCGRVEAAENVDYYKFAAKAGQVLTFEVYCARIQDKIHDLQKHADPLVTVFDADGKELAANDDGYFADPVLEFKVPKDGEYRVAVRDAKYDGDPRWAYALAVTDKPYARHLFPLAANPGQETTVEPVGSARLLRPAWTVTAPKTPGPHLVTLPYPGGQTNPVPLVVTPLPLVTEAEPNDTPKEATRITLPGGVNGRIGGKRDLDHFVFKAAKGKAVRLEVFARRFGTVLRSQLDSQLDVMTPDGKVVASNDDLNGKDAGLIFTPPADGDYVVRVRDLNNKGGDGFVYYLEADFARPDFTLKCDPSKAMIGPGSRTAWYVQVVRANGFAGPVKVEVAGLPAGVTVNPLTVPANMTQGCLVVSAAPDAKVDAAVVGVVGTADAADEAGKPVTLVRPAVAVEEIYFPGGGRGRFDAGMQAAAVTGPSDVMQVKVKQTRVALKPGEEVKIDVEVVRRPDYDKGLTLDVLLQHLGGVHGNPLPPGVTMVGGKSKTLLGTGSVGHIVLKAAPDAAECADVPICVQAYVPINFVVKIGYASEPIFVTVKK